MTIAIENGVATGWQLTDDGYRYVNEDETYVTDTWKLIDGLLYHFDENGYQRPPGIIPGRGRNLHFRTRLSDIQADLSWQLESTGENCQPRKATAFFCYLGRRTGRLSLQYRKATETKVMPWRRERAGSAHTRNSMRAYGDYVYHILPKGEERSGGRVFTDEERADRLCDIFVPHDSGSVEKRAIA